MELKHLFVHFFELLYQLFKSSENVKLLQKLFTSFALHFLRFCSSFLKLLLVLLYILFFSAHPQVLAASSAPQLGGQFRGQTGSI